MTNVCRGCGSSDEIHDYSFLYTGVYMGPWCRDCMWNPNHSCFVCTKKDCKLNKYCGIKCKECGKEPIRDDLLLCNDCNYATNHCQDCCDYWNMKSKSKVNNENCFTRTLYKNHK